MPAEESVDEIARVLRLGELRRIVRLLGCPRTDDHHAVDRICERACPGGDEVARQRLPGATLTSLDELPAQRLPEVAEPPVPRVGGQQRIAGQGLRKPFDVDRQLERDDPRWLRRPGIGERLLDLGALGRVDLAEEDDCECSVQRSGRP